MAREKSQDNPVAAAQTRVGQALNAKWTIERLLGVGGMGAVYAARHRNGAAAAVKLLHAELARDTNIRERFLREGKIANKVDHPARVPVTDDDVSDAGEPFLVMELLEGDTLNQVRSRAGGKMALAQTLEIFEVVLDLLGKCHGVGVVHRDIKPANIFVTKGGLVKVLDFGVARMREANSGVEATRAGTAIGTPAYIAPEQALGLVSQVDGRSDLFSVGACMYLSLSGERLNQARTEAESFVMAATQQAPSIANVAPDLPVEVVAFVDRALAFEREKRFQDAASMRSELLGLLAALRAGQLVASAPKKQTGLVTRGNEALEGDALLTDEEKKQIETRLQAVWKQIGICLADVRQYGWSHPQAVRAMELGFQQIADALVAHPASVRWDVGPGAFLFEGAAVWAPDRIPFDRVPYQLFADGVRRIQIKPGFTKEEFRDLVAIFLHDVVDVASSENDAVTALWDRRFEHVAYVAIESFAGGDAGDGDFAIGAIDLAREIAASAHLERDLDDGSLEAKAMRMNLANELRASGEAAAALAIDPLTRATLGAQLNMSDEAWQERFVDAFVDGALEASGTPELGLLEDALKEWTDDQLKLKNHLALFELAQAVGNTLLARATPVGAALERAIASTIFTRETLSAMLQDLERDGRDTALAGKEIPHAVIAGLGRALDRLEDASMLELACGCFAASRSEELGRVLFAYVTRWAKGNEARLGVVLETTAAEVGVAVIGVLSALGTTEAHHALEAAGRSPHLAVRIEALSVMPEERHEHVRVEVRKLLDDPQSSARTQALRLVAQRGLIAAGPALVLRIQSDDFHVLPADERRLWMESLMDLSPRRGTAVCAEILKKHQIIPSEGAETTRVLAAQVLAEHGATKEALEAAQEATKKRWWNTGPVREAAERAIGAIEARIAEGVPESKQTVARKKVELP
jgi:serine/threonine protein kinase